MPDTKTILPAIATVAASAMLLRSIANDFIPNEFRNYFFSSLHNISRRFSSHLTIVIDEFQGLSLNEVFEAAEAYLGTLATPSLQRIKVSKVTKEKKLGVALDRGEEICDVYEDHVQVTLSGLLNLIDGLWSCCTDERIIIFTTNHKEKLDPALTRPGRMDMHINMSYCTLSAFKQLAFNYHGLSHHQLFEQIEGHIGEVKVTPAEVAGELMKSRDAQTSLQGLINFLLEKKNQQEIVRPKLTTSVQKKSIHKEEEESKG
ncbi:hypothetical protein GBA52_013717 [Prunus armeniaca]|nr:hypothetical protein GBA52_013717 [Prunus armeniaca]